MVTACCCSFSMNWSGPIYHHQCPFEKVPHHLNTQVQTMLTVDIVSKPYTCSSKFIPTIGNIGDYYSSSLAHSFDCCNEACSAVLSSSTSKFMPLLQVLCPVARDYIQWCDSLSYFPCSDCCIHVHHEAWAYVLPCLKDNFCHNCSGISFRGLGCMLWKSTALVQMVICKRLVLENIIYIQPVRFHFRWMSLSSKMPETRWPYIPPR